MRIILANKFNHLKGGADKYFLDLADILAGAGMEVAKFSMASPENLADRHERYFVSQVDFNKGNLFQKLKAAGRLLYSFEAARKFERLVADFKPDLVHIHNIYHQISPSILPVAKRHGLPVIMHLHDYKLLCPNYRMFNRQGICEKCKGGKFYHCALDRCLKDSFSKSLLGSLEMYLQHKILKIWDRNIDLYIAPSEFMRAKAIEWGVEPGKIAVLPYFIKTGEFRPGGHGDDYLLFFGRLSPEKGIDTLIEAVEKLPEVKLKIVGSGPEFQVLKERIGSSGLKSRVELLGPKYGEELKGLVRNSLAVVVPSRWYEVSGIVNLEAAALGRPIIASDIGGIGEIVKDGINGLLFKPGDSEDLARKIGLLKTVDLPGLGDRAVSERFSPQIHLEKLRSIYERYVRKI